jgi:hypothetical protein
MDIFGLKIWGNFLALPSKRSTTWPSCKIVKYLSWSIHQKFRVWYTKISDMTTESFDLAEKEQRSDHEASLCSHTWEVLCMQSKCVCEFNSTLNFIVQPLLIVWIPSTKMKIKRLGETGNRFILFEGSFMVLCNSSGVPRPLSTCRSLYCDFAFEYNIHYTRINTPLYFLSKKTLPYI